MTILNTVHATGLPQALSRHVAAQPEEAAGVLAGALPLQLGATAGSAILVVAAAGGLGLLGDPLAPYLAAAALTVVPHGLLSLYMAYDNGLHDFRRQALVLALYSVAKTGFVIALALLYRGLGALAGYAAASLAVVVVGRHRRTAAPRRGARELLSFAAPVVALVGLSATQLNLDLLLVQGLRGASEEVGWYAAAQQVARAPYLGLTGLGMALLPIVAHREALADRSGLAGTVRQAIRYALLVLAPAVALLAAGAPAAMDLLYSAEYLPGAGPLPVLMPGMAALALFSVLASVLTGMGRPWLPVAIGAAALATTTVAALALIPRYGLVGAALATTIGGVAALAGVLAVVSRMLGPVVSALAVVRIAGAAVVLGAALALIRPSGPVFVPVACVGLAGYAAILIVVRELTGDDWRRLRGVVRRRGE